MKQQIDTDPGCEEEEAALFVLSTTLDTSDYE